MAILHREIQFLTRFHFMNNFVIGQISKIRLTVFSKSILATQWNRFELDTTLHYKNQLFSHIY